MRPNWLFVLPILFFLFPWGEPAHAYSLLTHEQLVDLTWDDSIVPLLLSRYPNLTPAELDQARAYAYGGCVIQDIGYSSYLLDATRPNRLWFHQFCERNRLHLNGLLGQPVEEFSA